MVLIAFGIGCEQPSRDDIAPASNPVITHQPAIPTLDTATTPRQLAEAACSTCHLFPEPYLLESNTWVRFALPYMEPWLGLAPSERERDRSGAYVLPEDAYIQVPFLNADQWRSIREFYATHAPPQQPPPPSKPRLRTNMTRFHVREFAYFRPAAMTAMVKIDPDRKRLLVGDALTRTLESRFADGRHEFTVEFDSTPISVRLRPDGMDLTTVGRLFPSDLARGKVLRLHRDGEEVRIDKVLGDLRRPTHVAYGDLNQDGLEDLVVAQFGHRLGRFSWFESQAGGAWIEHVLLDRPGAIRSVVRDLNGDKRPEIVVVTGQAWESVTLFLNQGGGGFEERTLLQQAPTFGYSWMEMADFNGDGHPDLLTSNGDSGDIVTPFKGYHGVRLHLNDGRNRFRESFFYPLNGAYKALPADFDHDGDMDIVAISWFPDYATTPEEGFVYLENEGDGRFTPWSLPESQLGRWLTMDAGDLDGDGDVDVVLGSLVQGPMTTPFPQRLTQRWENQPRAILLLENTTKEQ